MMRQGAIHLFFDNGLERIPKHCAATPSYSFTPLPRSLLLPPPRARWLQTELGGGTGHGRDAGSRCAGCLSLLIPP